MDTMMHEAAEATGDRRRRPMLGRKVGAGFPAFALLLSWALVSRPAPALGRAGGPPPAASARQPGNIADGRNPGVLQGGPAPGMAKAAGDTFYLYGGPGRWPGEPGFNLEGRFETALGYPDRQGWMGVDPTGLPPHWHIDSFNAANMAAAPAYWSGPYMVPVTNHAIWTGLAAGLAGFATTGYGNNWHDGLDHSYTVSNPADSTVITWDLQFNHDSEDGYDFFKVQWDSAGSMHDLARFSGTNKVGGVFVAPVVFHGVITYHAGDYVGVGHDEVHLRCRFDSDGAASDEDGLYVTGDGAVQLDNIQVQGTNGVGLSQATFEGGDLGGWTPRSPLVGSFGDFSKVLAGFQDLDPCRDDLSPQMCFVDDGTPPNSDPPQPSTGGTRSRTWNYGFPGGWVLHYPAGLALNDAPHNEVWSPPIAWDKPGAADDGVDGGAFLRFTVWEHLPLSDGFVWVWHVRSYPDANGGWTSWKDRNFVYFGGGAPSYITKQLECRDLLVAAPESVQLALGLWYLADLFNFPGNDATPSPCYDNVSFAKYDAVGAGIATREIDLFNDGFPTSGAISCTATDDMPLAIRLDMARDIRTSAQPRNVPGDSIICDFVARKPGSAVDASTIRMEILLEANPCFDAERAGGVAALQAGAGGGASDIQNLYGNVWRGYVKGKQAKAANGSPVANRYFFDLPDGPVTVASYETGEPALFFPGDQLRYYLVGSTINPAETALLPADTSGFGSGVNYSRIFTVYGLPSLSCGATDTDPCTQPKILVWNDGPDRGNVDEWAQVFDQNGLRLRQEYDQYRTNGPSSLVSNGLGSAGAHGANPGQLAGYNCLFYDSANLASGLISDGSSTGQNDKGNDVATLTGWMAQAGDRHAAYWGDNIANGLGGGGVTFRSTVMDLQLVGDNVRPSIGNQTAPEVGPTGAVAGFATRFIAFGGCPAVNLFDNLNPLAAGAVKAHEFRDPSGQSGAYSPSASVYYARTDVVDEQPYSRVNVTFPYGFLFIQDVLAKVGGRTARADLIRELLVKFGQGSLLDGEIVAADPIATRLLLVAQNHPNPFNPATTIELTAPARGELTVRIFNVRGELIATLVDGVVEPGKHALVWRGTDARGHEVGSGVYLCKVAGFGQERALKLAVLK
jgi:hypothetical protein